ncbi:DUF5615 family PIN-like protein [Candidatus Bipolaricaulota bacterium]|nr:DUF5615 family PIN-like protein [Candidatus Bipolaricaulota bacterium]
MSPSSIKIYTDEDVTNSVAKALKRRGLKAWTTPEKDNRGLTDIEQIKYATRLGACLLTHNVEDFPRIHYSFRERGGSHSGIIVAKQGSIGSIVKGVLKLAAEMGPSDMKNRLEYLSNWT